MFWTDCLTVTVSKLRLEFYVFCLVSFSWFWFCSGVTVRSLWCSRHTQEVSGFTAVQQKNIQEHPEPSHTAGPDPVTDR